MITVSVFYVIIFVCYKLTEVVIAIYVHGEGNDLYYVHV